MEMNWTGLGTEDGKEIFFIGIGGIGMSALARYFKSKGYAVTGYDRTPTELTESLAGIGIAVAYEDVAATYPQQPSAVIYTPAIPKDNVGLEYYRQSGVPLYKRSDVLQWITANSFSICIAGTHGKTTITTLTAHLLRHSGFGCTAFLGGISANYGTNFWEGPNNVAVVEADEYDRSFLKLSPDVAVISFMDADHLDIYGTAQEVENAYIAFAKKIKPNGLLVAKADLKRNDELLAPTKINYSLNENPNQVYARSVTARNGAYRFDVVHPMGDIVGCVLPIGGRHNVENALAAISVAKHLGVDNEKIKAGLASFKGVKRRFEYILNEPGCVLIDDYAHHPKELAALVQGVRELHPEEIFHLVFQPHLFSRTKDFEDEFAEVLGQADHLLLLPIYPAREKPIEGVTSNIVLDKTTCPQKAVLDKQDLLEWVRANRPRLLVMAGAGDIDALVDNVKRIMIGQKNETS